MDLLDILLEEFYDSNREIKKTDIPEGFGIPITPVVSYFCFNSPLDMTYYKDDLLKEDILEEKKSIEKSAFKKANKEMKIAKKGGISKETGTVYKLTKEQKRALKYIRRKYGKEIIEEIKKFRKNFLAPYQVIKSNLEKSKSIYPKDVLGMSKEEYLRAKKRAEYKIENMRSNRYVDLNKEFMELSSKGKNIDELKATLKNSKGELNKTLLRRVFEKYNMSSKRFSDDDFLAIQNKIKNKEAFMGNLVDRASSDSMSKEELDKLKEIEKSIQDEKSRMTKSYSDKKTKENIMKTFSVSDKSDIRNISKKIDGIESAIKGLGISEKEKEEALDRVKKYVSIKGERITDKTFQDEYELFLVRQRIKDQIERGIDNKYLDEYIYQLSKAKERNIGRRDELLSAMSRERLSKTLSDTEKRIYQLKPNAPKDSDKLEDYTLKIKEEDFFEPVFFSKSKEMREAEKKIDAEIKRFERGLQAKMEEKDFRLLKKYMLINNLLTIKDLKSVKSLFARKK